MGLCNSSLWSIPSEMFEQIGKIFGKWVSLDEIIIRNSWCKLFANELPGKLYHSKEMIDFTLMSFVLDYWPFSLEIKLYLVQVNLLWNGAFNCWLDVITSKPHDRKSMIMDNGKSAQIMLINGNLVTVACYGVSLIPAGHLTVFIIQRNSMHT